MKKTFSRILAIAVVLTVLAGLLIGLVPAAALSAPTVTVSVPVIRTAANYTINFTTGKFIPAGGIIQFTFPPDTNVVGLGVAGVGTPGVVQYGAGAGFNGVLVALAGQVPSKITLCTPPAKATCSAGYSLDPRLTPRFRFAASRRI